MKFYKKNLLFLKLLNQVLKKIPYLGIFLCFQYHRSIYPTDNNRKFKIKELYRRLDNLLNKLITLSKIFLSFDRDKNNFKQKKFRIYDVYHNVFNKISINDKKRIIKNKKYLKKLFKNLNFRNIDVLDVGSGSGIYTKAFLELKAKKVYSLDFVNLIKFQKKFIKNNKKVQFITGDLMNVKIKKKFDFIFSNGVFGYQKNIYKTLEKYHNLLKKDGKMYFSLYSNYGLFWKIIKKINSIMKSIPMQYSMSSLENLFVPNTRTIFLDNWYNPEIRFYDKKKVINNLKKLGYKFELLKPTRKFDIVFNKKYFDFYGYGELRFLVYKT